MRKVKSRSQKSWSLFVWPHHIIRYADANYVNSVVTTYRCAIQTQDIPGQKSIIHTSLLHEYTIYTYVCVCVVWPLLNHAFFSNKNQLIPPALWASAVKGASSSVGGSFCSNPCVELICVSATHLGMNAVWNHQWEWTMDVSPIKSSQLPLVRDVNPNPTQLVELKKKG